MEMRKVNNDNKSVTCTAKWVNSPDGKTAVEFSVGAISITVKTPQNMTDDEREVFDLMVLNFWESVFEPGVTKLAAVSRAAG